MYMWTETVIIIRIYCSGHDWSHLRHEYESCTRLARDSYETRYDTLYTRNKENSAFS